MEKSQGDDVRKRQPRPKTDEGMGVDPHRFIKLAKERVGVSKAQHRTDGSMQNPPENYLRISPHALLRRRTARKSTEYPCMWMDKEVMSHLQREGNKNSRVRYFVFAAYGIFDRRI